MFWIWFFFLIGIIILLSLISGFVGILALLWDYLTKPKSKRYCISSETLSRTPLRAEKEYGESSATLDMQDEEGRV